MGTARMACPQWLRKGWLVVAAGLTLAFGLTGCGDDEGETPSMAAAVDTAAVKEPTVDDAKPKAEETAQVYTYNAIGKRDPFRTYFAELEHEETQTAKLTELQRYDIDQLKLVAVIVGTATPVALVEDPTGMGHTIKVGTLIGKHWGQVKHIRRGEVIIQEEFRDFTGRRVTNLVPIKLPEEKVEKPAE